ncbi:hypothetical protein [Micromonospora inyonensis]|uniref:Molybdopterin molybdenumtransferase n=1 Tax=Micromonospora inyonensis TaxID=47866 RepID=A0A1C6S6G5_9ACTN|nr:hypothetical protein [Micromonospora inyonensis]SCL25030.1 MoeA N-terminal region (domain I and II) [Micromonospora inyonensis]
MDGERADWGEARALAPSVAEPLAPNRPHPAAAVGTTLARPLLALIDLPSFDRSAMDGYAVRGAPRWTIRGRVDAGQAAGSVLRPSEARGAATGASVPEGTDRMLPNGQALRHERSVTAAAMAPLGRHVRRAGEERRRGEQLAPVGTRVTSQLAALAAAVGNDLLEVHLRPLAGALPPGDELCTRGLPRRPGIPALSPARVLAGVAEPVTHVGSAMVRGAAGADAIAVVGPGEGPVRLIALPGGGC